MLHEGDPRLSQWSMSAAQATKWMEDAKWIAVAGYRQVLEDGRDVCDSESDAEYSDRGEVLADQGTPDMYNKKGELVPSGARLTTEQATALRARGREGGRATVSGKGEWTHAGKFECLSHTFPRDYYSGNTTDRPSLQCSKDVIRVWLNWALCPAGHPRGIRCIQHPSWA
jgi:hypothetical protein